jgi:4-hydroxy-tetrahydrodipicolinate synthase
MKTPFPRYLPSGVIPACLLPFNDDLTIDERGFREHINDVANVRGVSAITVNGHSCEVSSCDRDEQQRVLDMALEEIGSKLPVIAGVYADGSLQAARIARDSADRGASALLVFPPTVLTRGNQQRPESMISHVRRIADATDIPLIIFQYALSSGLTYPLAALTQMAAEIPTVVAIKDSSADPVLHERHVQVLQNLPRPLNVLSSHSAWLAASLTSGCNGLLSGSGSVIANLHVQLWEAVQRQDLAAIRQVDALIRPTAEAFYAPPLFDMHNRMKEALVHLGRMRSAAVRPPLLKLTAAEVQRIHTAVRLAGLAPSKVAA